MSIEPSVETKIKEFSESIADALDMDRESMTGHDEDYAYAEKMFREILSTQQAQMREALIDRINDGLKIEAEYQISSDMLDIIKGKK